MNSAPIVIVYGSRTCGYCGAARMLLTKKGVAFEEFIISDDPALADEMQKRSGRQTVPQIFVGDTHVGGFDELNALEQAGELDKLLTG